MELNNCKSISLRIAAKTLCDSFSAQTFDSVELDQLLTGNIKDVSYDFKVEEISFNGGVLTVSGKYDIDDILNKGMHVLFVPSIPAGNVTAENTMQALAGVLGKTLNINITNFYPADFPLNPTGKELISSLFGWTDKIPRYQINVFIRGNVINVLERGKETGVNEIFQYANVTVNYKKLRTLQDPIDVAGMEITGTLAGQTPQQDPPAPTNYISGIFLNGDLSITYQNGLVVKEIHTVNGFDEITLYEYSSSMPPAYLTSKNTVTADGEINVVYSYNGGNLLKEVEEHSKDDVVNLKRITRHYPIGQGLWGTSIEENDVTTYGGISQGAPGGLASAYSIAENSETAKTPEDNREPPTYILPGKPYSKYLGTIPVSDSTTLARVANEIIWMDKKTEIHVTLDAYADFVFDLSKKVLWQRTEYFLESNNVIVNPEITTQRLELVRWA